MGLKILLFISCYCYCFPVILSSKLIEITTIAVYLFPLLLLLLLFYYYFFFFKLPDMLKLSDRLCDTTSRPNADRHCL